MFMMSERSTAREARDCSLKQTFVDKLISRLRYNSSLSGDADTAAC